jgi:hypothetical protein
MRGDYADTLTTITAVGNLGGRPVATASTAYPAAEPEIAVIEEVMTLEQYRGRGIAAAMSDFVADIAFSSGCLACYLGNSPRSRSVYENIGFRRIDGCIMRRPAPGSEDAEDALFAAGQETTIRETAWGDLPGFAALVAQPGPVTLLDYPRGLVSAGHWPLRCVGNFTTIRYATLDADGCLLTVQGESPFRVLGFGSLTPGPPPARTHMGDVDIALHENYGDAAEPLISDLIARAVEKNLSDLRARILRSDDIKLDWFAAAGFQRESLLSGEVVVDGRKADVIVLRRSLEPRNS